jgi:predicted PurR-regulated permease PerM
MDTHEPRIQYSPQSPVFEIGPSASGPRDTGGKSPDLCDHVPRRLPHRVDDLSARSRNSDRLPRCGGMGPGRWVATAARIPWQDSSGWPFIQEQLRTFELEGSGYEGSIVERTKSVGAFLLGQMSGLARDAFSVTIDFSIMLFALFFFYKDGGHLFRRLYHLLPLEERHKDKVFVRLDKTMKAVVRGVLVTALMQGLLAAVAYVVLGVPFVLVLATLTALFSLLPVGGTALVWLPVAGYLFWSGPIWKAIAMAAWGSLVVVGVVDNFLKPLLIGQGTQLPMLFLFLSIVGGLAAYGFIGVFFGPILLAILLTAIHIYEEEYQMKRRRIPKIGTAA